MKNVKFMQGFTIIELTAVMVIIMILASLIVGVGSTARRKAMETKAESMIAALEVALSMYHADVGGYPPNSDASVTPNTPIAVVYDYLTHTDHESGGAREISGWKGPYMEFDRKDISSGEIIDPWGAAYNYNSLNPTGNPNSFDLWSNGLNKDNNFGWVDDIPNW